VTLRSFLKEDAAVQAAREADRPVPGAAPAGPLDVSPLLGTWVNTDPESAGIVRIEIAAADQGGLVVGVRAAGQPSPRDWGEVRAETVYADGLQSARAVAFTARFDLDVLEVHLQANQNQGLLVVASFHRFKDGSGRADYFAREFYRR
jgi:hypothetical protein